MMATTPHDDEATMDRLFGVEGADTLWTDIGACYETDIEPWADVHFEDPAKWLPRTIEEWTTHDPTYHLPAISHLLEWIGEWTADCGEVDEGWWDRYNDAAKTEQVQVAVRALYAAIGEQVPYRMAKERVRTYTVTWDAEGEPLLDGEPLYRSVTAWTERPAEPQGSGSSPHP